MAHTTRIAAVVALLLIAGIVLAPGQDVGGPTVAIHPVRLAAADHCTVVDPETGNVTLEPDECIND